MRYFDPRHRAAQLLTYHFTGPNRQDGFSISEHIDLANELLPDWHLYDDATAYPEKWLTNDYAFRGCMIAFRKVASRMVAQKNKKLREESKQLQGDLMEVYHRHYAWFVDRQTDVFLAEMSVTPGKQIILPEECHDWVGFCNIQLGFEKQEEHLQNRIKNIEAQIEVASGRIPGTEGS
ncbi:hypothetical protein F53441_12943 [Fusarium austroafricanum]|uniref:Uncharacterized protein n=1 Tax=Fusarium austroafricanum TaxID=2364996 RepID=A0A8H4JUA9_9HYPO|nr:hypothetical protein F53441_12943 [Fusarium austroafricanum]